MIEPSEILRVFGAGRKVRLYGLKIIHEKHQMMGNVIKFGLRQRISNMQRLYYHGIKMKYLFLFSAFVFPNLSYAQSPPACEHWPKTMALMSMKNAGIADPTQVNESATKATLLAYQVLPNGIFKEIYNITYFSKDGKHVFEVVTPSESSYEECSLSDVKTFLISKHLD